MRKVGSVSCCCFNLSCKQFLSNFKFGFGSSNNLLSLRHPVAIDPILSSSSSATETDDILDLVEALQGDFPDIAFEDPFELFPAAAVKPMMQ